MNNVIKEMPDSKNVFLWFQVGEVTSRPMELPCYDGKRFIGYRQSSAMVPVFNLAGFGKTLKAAEQMAAINRGHKFEANCPTIAKLFKDLVTA